MCFANTSCHAFKSSCEAQEPASSPVPVPVQSKAEAKPKAAAIKKRPSTSGDAPAKKRRKKSPVPDESSELSEPGEEVGDMEDDITPPKPVKERHSKPKSKPAPKPKAKPRPRKPAKKKKVESEDDEDEVAAEDEADLAGNEDKKNVTKAEANLPDVDAADSPLSEVPSDIERDATAMAPSSTEANKESNGVSAAATGKKAAADSDDDSPLSDAPESELAKPSEKPAAAAGDNEDSSELSDVMDEPPPPSKQKRKSKDGTAARGKGSAKNKSASSAAKKAGGAAQLTADEAEMKKLQGQLAKCGMRKIWAFELKKYGDDTRAKVRHLRGVLRDLGMDGRFSEAKAREIKERRELEADLEAVQEMDKNWGAGRRGKVSRGRNSHAKETSEDDGEGEAGSKGGKGADGKASGAESGGNDEDENAPPAARGRGSAKYRADLAFLGDSDSDSD